jgi:hypothetical protein
MEAASKLEAILKAVAETEDHATTDYSSSQVFHA